MIKFGIKERKRIFLSACIMMMASGNISADPEYHETQDVSEQTSVPVDETRAPQIRDSEGYSSVYEREYEKSNNTDRIEPISNDYNYINIKENVIGGSSDDDFDNDTSGIDSVENAQSAPDRTETDSAEEYDLSIYDTSFHNKITSLPTRESILKDDELMMNLNQEKDDIEQMSDGEIVDVSHYTELATVYPELFSERQIAYAIPTERPLKEVILSVYHKNGSYYSLISDANDPDRETARSKFISKVNHVNFDSSTNAGNIYYLTLSMSFYGTYYEAGSPRTGLKGKYETAFYLERNIMTDGNYDQWIVNDSNYIDPYYGIAMVTTRYSHGIAPYYQGSIIVTGAPETSIVDAAEYSYSISAGFPPAVGFSFGWTGSVGTKIQAGIRQTMHDIIFTNPQGIYQNHPDGSLQFRYDTSTVFILPKTVSSSFMFQFNQVFFNAVYGNQSGMVKHGDFWRVVIPTTSDPDTYGGDPPIDDSTVSVYYKDGIDYSPVFDPEYYSTKYADLKAAFGNSVDALFEHFINNGMDEGRQASAQFNPVAYKNRYPDLQAAFGDHWRQYYLHYLNNGIKEGRTGT